MFFNVKLKESVIKQTLRLMKEKMDKKIEGIPDDQITYGLNLSFSGSNQRDPNLDLSKFRKDAKIVEAV